MRIVLFLAVILCANHIFAQDDQALQTILSKTNVDRLNQMAVQFRVRDSLAKLEAYRKAEIKGWPIRIQTDNETAELMKLDDRGNPIYYTTGNEAAAISTQVDQLHTGGGSGYNLEGSGMTIGEWDGGATRGTHEQLSGRVNQADGATGISDHATHVAGTLIGDGTPVASAKGMAPLANLDAYDWNSDNGEMAMAAANGLLISNHSYGFITGWRGSNEWYGGQYEDEAYGFGIYNWYAIDWDDIALNAPYYLICKSAGNDRNDGAPSTGTQWELNGATDTLYTYDPVNHPESSPEGDGGSVGYDCISWTGNAKNILTVGAVADVTSYTGPGSVNMSGFSGWGPTDDGRIKPDIVGNGVVLNSSVGGADNQYASYSGTSMSSPNVAGSLLLLQEHYMGTHGNNPMLAATLKGLTIHTARECGGWNGPDYEFGWGLLSAKDAADLISDDITKDSTIAEMSLANGDTITYVFESDGTQPLRATICWTDIPGPNSYYTLNDPSIKLVNDLDMRISNSSTTYEPYVLSPTTPGSPATTGDNYLDNVEQIYIANPVAGQYTLTVTHKGGLVSAPQDFSMIVSGQTNLLLPVEFIGVNGRAMQSHNEITCDLYEENLEALQLQRWEAGKFTPLLTLPSKGDNGFQTYVFKDEQLSKFKSHYLYRIKAIDIDGNTDYSSIVSLTRNPDEPPFSIYPNPVEDILHISNGQMLEKLMLVTSNGKLLKAWNLVIPAQLDMQLLPSGTYFLIGEAKGKLFSHRVLKQ